MVGTAQMSVSGSNTSFVLIPCLRQTINVPANAKVFISTDGSAQDGSAITQRRLVLSNTPAVGAMIGN